MIRALLSNLIKVSLVVALLIVIVHTISDAMQEQRPNTVEFLATRSATAPATALPQLVDLNEPEEEGDRNTEQMLLIFREIKAEPTPEPLVYTVLTRAELERASADGLWQETALTYNPIAAFSRAMLESTATPTYVRPTITPSVAASVTPRPTQSIIVQDNNPEPAANQEQPPPPVAGNNDVGEAISAPPNDPPPPPPNDPPPPPPPTNVPPTAVPPTPIPPTPVPPTPVPPTPVPPTPIPPTPVPPTPIPPTPEPPIIELPPILELPPLLPEQPQNNDDDDDDRRSGRDSSDRRGGRGRGSGRSS